MLVLGSANMDDIQCYFAEVSDSTNHNVSSDFHFTQKRKKITCLYQTIFSCFTVSMNIQFANG